MRMSLSRKLTLKFKQSHGFVSFLLQVTENILSKFSPLKNESGNLRRFIAVNGIKEIATSPNLENLPEIEVFLPSTLKDVNVLILSIKSCINNSINPISRISIAVPTNEKAQFEIELASLGEIEIQVLDESTMISPKMIGRIREIFGSRSGWVLAEFLKLYFVTQSNSPGVLVLDSDTILLRPQLWLDNDGIQSIFPVQERQSGYFELLSKLGLDMDTVEYSFMSHYMLMQPDIYKTMYSELAKSDPEILLERIITNRDPESKSPFCICFEAYSHFGLKRYRARFKFSKWSNFGIKRKLFLEDSQEILIYSTKSKMKSLSVHAYL